MTSIGPTLLSPARRSAAPVEGDGFTLSRLDRLASGQRTVGVAFVDVQLENALAHRIDWSVSSPNSPYVRQTQQYRDAKIAARLLATVGTILAIRAAIVPSVLRFITPPQETQVISALSAYLDPTAAWVTGGLAAVVILCAMLAGRRPLMMTMLALLAFIGASIPLVLANPDFIRGGHIERAIIGLLLLRAAFAGLAHRMR